MQVVSAADAHWLTSTNLGSQTQLDWRGLYKVLQGLFNFNPDLRSAASLGRLPRLCSAHAPPPPPPPGVEEGTCAESGIFPQALLHFASSMLLIPEEYHWYYSRMSPTISKAVRSPKPLPPPPPRRPARPEDRAGLAGQDLKASQIVHT